MRSLPLLALGRPVCDLVNRRMAGVSPPQGLPFQPSRYATASLAAFTGRALTIFRAGFALNIVGSFAPSPRPWMTIRHATSRILNDTGKHCFQVASPSSYGGDAPKLANTQVPQ